MSTELEPLESYYASGSFRGMLRSGRVLLNARRVRKQSETQERSTVGDIRKRLLYLLLIGIPAFFLNLYQSIRTLFTREPRRHPQGSWQFYLSWALRNDLAHFTNETVGYHEQRPPEASELDDLTAWVMTLIQFVWGYEELMSAIWDEWTWLRLIQEAVDEADLTRDERFLRIVRQWEMKRTYAAPLNGTYAEVRWAKFYAFMRSLMNALPQDAQRNISETYKTLSEEKRRDYQKQMSLLARTVPGRFQDGKEPIPLWDACIAIVYGGRYFLINIAAHDAEGNPVVYSQSGSHWSLKFKRGKPVDPDGNTLYLDGDQLYREKDDKWVGYLDMAPASNVEWQMQQILQHPQQEAWEAEQAVDILLAETPRTAQRKLRGLLSRETQRSLDHLRNAPVVINWDQRSRDRSLAELRRTHRGIGDHPLTVIRTDESIIFDMSHVFFDGTWSLAMAEVLTTAAIHWCTRIVNISPSEAPPAQRLKLEPSKNFLKEARARQQHPEISAETTIYDISVLFSLRDLLKPTGTFLTINDLLVIGRIFHAAHYRPSTAMQEALDVFRTTAQTAAEKRAVSAIDHSLKRGRLTNPALLIPVDASILDPQERLFPITFRNLADSLVWIWDETWDAYQEWRKIEPPDTPEGMAALQEFARKRTFLVGNMRAFSYILEANKSVAQRGESFNIAILKLLAHLPPWLQHTLNAIPERFTVLNEILKGDEVYSNVGRVAESSTLTRFMTAKDDGNTKALAWGIMTDDDGRMIITMRDFRPHVSPLIDAGRIDLAQQLAQDYVVSYTQSLIGLVARLSAMLQAATPEIGPGESPKTLIMRRPKVG